MAYRYRDDSGSTRYSTDRSVKHLHKIGRVMRIRGKRWCGKWGLREAVVVSGTLGHLRLMGFCWGYSGEGPRGLRAFLERVGVGSQLAIKVAHQTDRLDEVGVDWTLSRLSDGSWQFQAQTTLLPETETNALAAGY